MRILDLEREPFYAISFQNAARRGGVVSQMLPFLRGRVDALPDGLESLLVTSDLQGVAACPGSAGEPVLLGQAVSAIYADLAREKVVAPLDKTGVLLAGDLYSAPAGDKRGASGDVRDVWLTFAAGYRWVAGVAGNHDRFGSESELEDFERQPGVHLLDSDVVELDGLRIGGVGWIPGNPAKPGRRDEEEFYAALDVVADEGPDILILHQGPNGQSDQRGDQRSRDRLEAGFSGLAICGHSHWDDPLAEISGAQVLNADARVVILTA